MSYRQTRFTVISACRRRGVRFSVTCRIDAKIRAACAGIGEQQWVDIKHPQAVWDADQQRWIPDAQIAETTYTAFVGTRHQVTESAPGSSTSPPGSHRVRTIHLHLPDHWPWTAGIDNLFTAVHTTPG